MNPGYVAGIIFFIILIIIIVLIFFFFIGTNKTNNNNRPVRSPCTSTNQCAPGLTCTDGQCLSPIGGPCSNINDCVPESTACFQGICTNAVLSGPGGDPPCLPGLVVQDGICVVPDMGMCTSSSDCVEGSRCYNGRCIKRKRGFGKPCSESIRCDPGFSCDDGTCKIANDSNIPCMKDNQCVSGSYCYKNRCVDEEESSSSSFCPRSSSTSSSSSKYNTSRSSSSRKCPRHKSTSHSKKNNSSDSSSSGYEGYNVIDANIEPGSSSVYNTMDLDDNISNGIILTSGGNKSDKSVIMSTETSVISKELIRRLKK